MLVKWRLISCILFRRSAEASWRIVTPHSLMGKRLVPHTRRLTLSDALWDVLPELEKAACRSFAAQISSWFLYGDTPAHLQRLAEGGGRHGLRICVHRCTYQPAFTVFATPARLTNRCFPAREAEFPFLMQRSSVKKRLFYGDIPASAKM